MLYFSVLWMLKYDDNLVGQLTWSAGASKEQLPVGAAWDRHTISSRGQGDKKKLNIFYLKIKPSHWSIGLNKIISRLPGNPSKQKEPGK